MTQKALTVTHLWVRAWCEEMQITRNQPEREQESLEPVPFSFWFIHSAFAETYYCVLINPIQNAGNAEISTVSSEL
jgi:hypothetical protein